jgi:hypothetical protein
MLLIKTSFGVGVNGNPQMPAE